MPTSLATPSSTEALQAQSLIQLFEYQQALKTLLDARQKSSSWRW